MKAEPLKKNRANDRQWYGDILSPPAEPNRAFILDGCTYEELYRLAGGLYRLTSSRKTERPLLCLCTDDKALLMAALLASLAGGPHLVLPYAFSPQALTEVLETLSPSYFLTDRPESVNFPKGPAVVSPSSLSREALTPETMQDPDEPFLTLFTGGSTGIPKIWPKTPRNMFAEARYQAGAFGISPEDIFLSTVPPNHIYGLLFSVLAPFVSLSRVLNGTYIFPREILKAAQDYRASVLVSVPAHYRVLKAEDLERGNFRLALSSAGVLDKNDAAYFREKTGLDIVEIYGSTETGGIATRRRSQDDELWHPMAPVAWKIRDDRLCVRSDFLSPALPRDGKGYFVTSDCVDAGGHDQFILRGRADDVVKIGGKRVDMAAVQAKLKQVPGVRDAVVIAVPSGRGRQNELAAIVATHLSALQLRQHLLLVSEAYAVPKRMSIVDEIPVTPTGKYERAEIELILKSEK